MNWQQLPTANGPFSAKIRPPGSKSITIRALVIAGLAAGRSHLYGALRADDTAAIVRVLRGFGIEIHDDVEPWTVVGHGGHLVAPTDPIDVGLSGLTARIAMVLAAHADGATRIEAQGRLLQRPIDGLVKSLESQGARVETDAGNLPVTIDGVGGLWGGQLAVDSSQTSQFATALMLLAPLMVEGATLSLEEIESSHGYAELTARVMEDFGASVVPTITGFEIARGEYRATDFVIEPDASAAAYPLVAAAITGSHVEIEGLTTESRQPDIAVTSVLEAMGCRVADTEGGLTLQGPTGPLSPIEVDMSSAPDGALAVAVACMFAAGSSRISGLSSLQHKESDRLKALQSEMEALGCRVGIATDTLSIEPDGLHGATVDSHGDHRIAMAMGLAGLRIEGVGVENPEVVSKTWPGYWNAMEALVTSSSIPSPTLGTLVTIDGPAGTGKSTVSRVVAERTGLPHLDTGAFYRAATLAALRSGVDLGNEPAVTRVVENAQFDQRDGKMLLNDEDVSSEIREEHVTGAVSLVSSHPQVRTVLVDHQRRWIADQGGSGVVEGRDIGTTVFPDANIKVYLDASQEERARRRAEQTGEDYDTVLEDQIRRDRFDSSREASPLTVPSGAVVIDTTTLTFDGVVEEVLALIAENS